MKALFVCSGNRGISPIVYSQAKALESCGIDVEIFPVIGKGLLGYLRSMPKLRKHFLKSKPDVVHAHYSLCGFAAGVSCVHPLVTSLMGSDVKSSVLSRRLIRFFVKHAWAATIVKSQDMKTNLGIDAVEVIPNGVDLDLFRPMDKQHCRKAIGWQSDQKFVLFAANPIRPEKNYALAEATISELDITDLHLIVVFGVDHRQMPLYLNAADVLLMTSLWEGSPNVVKEAMACNTPVVTTDVGDVQWLYEPGINFSICTSKPSDLATAIERAISIPKNSDLRTRLIRLGLDSNSVSHRLLEVYKKATAVG